MIVFAALLSLFAVAVSESVGLFALVILAIAVFNFATGVLWLVR
jgi:hypothetical protein